MFLKKIVYILLIVLLLVVISIGIFYLYMLISLGSMALNEINALI